MTLPNMASMISIIVQYLKLSTRHYYFILFSLWPSDQHRLSLTLLNPDVFSSIFAIQCCLFIAFC